MTKNKLSIPQIRKRLRQIGNEEDLPELTELADQMYRVTAKRRAPIRSRKVTAQKAEEIRQYASNNPGKHQQDIAEKFGINHGRVSEALNHQR